MFTADQQRHGVASSDIGGRTADRRRLLGRQGHGRGPGETRFGDGLVSLAATLVAYASTELAHGYGFLAVFVAAVVIRQSEREHQYHAALNLFAEQCERLLMALRRSAPVRSAPDRSAPAR